MHKTIRFGKKYKKGELTDYFFEVLKEKVTRYVLKVEENASKLKEGEEKFMPPAILSEKEKRVINRDSIRNADKTIKTRNNKKAER